jgi:hypothetical protein
LASPPPHPCEEEGVDLQKCPPPFLSPANMPRFIVYAISAKEEREFNL